MKSKQKQRRAQVRRQKAKAKRNAQRSKNPARGSAGIELPSEASSVSPGSRGVEAFPIPLDHRSLERALATFAPGPDDDDLSAAQDIMYEAYDAPDARTRVELAREALSVSRD